MYPPWRIQLSDVRRGKSVHNAVSLKLQANFAKHFYSLQNLVCFRSKMQTTGVSHMLVDDRPLQMVAIQLVHA